FLCEGVGGGRRAMPLLFGQPEAVVDLRHDGRRGEFLITPPPAKRRLRRFFRRRDAASALPGDLEELGFHQEQLRESLRRTRVAGPAARREVAPARDAGPARA